MAFLHEHQNTEQLKFSVVCQGRGRTRVHLEVPSKGQGAVDERADGRHPAHEPAGPDAGQRAYSCSGDRCGTRPRDAADSCRYRLWASEERRALAVHRGDHTMEVAPPTADAAATWRRELQDDALQIADTWRGSGTVVADMVSSSR